MKTHIPECIVPWISECICEQLRMCENRMIETVHNTILHHYNRYSWPAIYGPDLIDAIEKNNTSTSK